MLEYTSAKVSQASIWSGSINPGDTVYTCLRHRSMSPNGNSTRYVDVFVVLDGKIRCISREVAHLTGLPWSDRRECVKTGHSAEALVHLLGIKLFSLPGHVLNHEEL